MGKGHSYVLDRDGTPEIGNRDVLLGSVGPAASWLGGL